MGKVVKFNKLNNRIYAISYEVVHKGGTKAQISWKSLSVFLTKKNFERELDTLRTTSGIFNIQCWEYVLTPIGGTYNKTSGSVV